MMSTTRKTIRRARRLSIAVLALGILLLAGGQWQLNRFVQRCRERSPFESSALSHAAGLESLDQMSFEEFERARDLYRMQLRELAEGTAGRLYRLFEIQVAGAVLCLLGSLPLVRSTRGRVAVAADQAYPRDPADGLVNDISSAEGPLALPDP